MALNFSPDIVTNRFLGHCKIGFHVWRFLVFSSLFRDSWRAFDVLWAAYWKWRSSANLPAYVANKSAFWQDVSSLSGKVDLHLPIVVFKSSLKLAMEFFVSRASLRRLSSVAFRSLSSASWIISSNFFWRSSELLLALMGLISRPLGTVFCWSYSSKCLILPRDRERAFSVSTSESTFFFKIDTNAALLWDLKSP